jgi:uracil-DNA glycosylase family 4
MSKQNIKLFDIFDNPEPAAVDVKQVIQSLKPHCTNCRLGFLSSNKNSKGIFGQGDPMAKIAVLADYPYPIDILMNKFLEGGGGAEWQRWILASGLKQKDLYYLYVTQCRTPEVFIKEQKLYRPPLQDEIQKCFSPRALQVLQSMPNLEVVIALGNIAARALIGRDVTKKSSEGIWFGTDLLPNVAVYCLPHPRDVEVSDTANQRGRAVQLLEFFQNEYLQEDKKILTILQVSQKERQAERQQYVL